MRYAFLLLLLSGCVTLDQSNYVKIKWHKTETAWKDAAKLSGPGKKTHDAKGFYFFDGEVCHVFAPDPPMINREYTKGQWGTLGHEAKHCFDRDFHN